MKKFVSVLLAFIMLLFAAVPAFAVDYVDFNSRGDTVPMIRFSGDGIALAEADGETSIGNMKDVVMNAFKGGSDDGNIKESVMNVVKPLLIDGMLKNNLDPYFAALQKEIADLFEPLALDNNGEVPNGSGIPNTRKQSMADNVAVDKKAVRGYYEYNDYWFWYDWRLDPFQTAEELREFVLKVKDVTGAPKVGFITSCLGGAVALAYVEKYGTDDLAGVSFDGTIANGSEFLGESISGNFEVNGEALFRFLVDLDEEKVLKIDDIILESVNMLDEAGLLGGKNSLTKTALFKKLYSGAASALALATVFTMPSYWACVSAKDYDAAMLTVFGKEGSEKRKTYAGLIEKIENYNVLVRQRIPELLDRIDKSGNLCFISKYGQQLVPICKNADLVADRYVSVNKSSFGATTSTVYDTLPDSFIARVTAAGKEKYVSPDKQVYAGTCLYPDYTWFIKGTDHSNWTLWEQVLAYQVLRADRQLTIDDFDFSQFRVFSNEDSTISDMTAENCKTEYWTAVKDERSNLKRIFDFPVIFFKWLKSIFSLLINK